MCTTTVALNMWRTLCTFLKKKKVMNWTYVYLLLRVKASPLIQVFILTLQNESNLPKKTSVFGPWTIWIPRTWKIDLLNQYFVPADINEILKIPPSSRLDVDHLAWAPVRHGIVQSAYGMAMDELWCQLNFLVQLPMVWGKFGIWYGNLLFHQRFITLLGD